MGRGLPGQRSVRVRHDYVVGVVLWIQGNSSSVCYGLEDRDAL